MKLVFSLLLIFFININIQSFSKTENVKPLTIAYSVPELKSSYFQALVDGCKNYSIQLGFDFLYQDAKNSAFKQYSDIISFINLDVDVIICSPVNPEYIKDLVEVCHNKGIVFINPIKKVNGADAWILVDEYDFGYAGGLIAGKYIFDYLDGKADILVLTYPDDQPSLKLREKGLLQGIMRFAPNSNIVSKIIADTVELGMIATDRALTDNRNIKVIVAINDDSALGAYESVRTMVPEVYDFCIVGLEATDKALAKMKYPDSIYRGTVGTDPYGTGKLIIDTSINVLKNGPLNHIVYIPMKPITRDNISIY